MKNMTIYRVKFKTRYHGSSIIQDDSINVAVRGDADRAVNKAKKHALSEVIRYEDDNGKKIRTRRRLFQLHGVEFVASADI